MAVRKLVTGAVSAALGTGLLIVLSSSPAAASSDEITAPSDDAEITEGPSVRITAELGLAQSAKLRLRGPEDNRFHTVDEGWQETLAYRLDISCPDYSAPCEGRSPAHNGEYTVRVVDSGLLTSGDVEDEHVFTLRVPPQKPREVTAQAEGGTSVRLRWAPGQEPDLTAYDVLDVTGARLKRVDAGQVCAEGSCSTVLSVPARAHERRVSYAVRAHRTVVPGSGQTVASGPSEKAATTVPPAPTPTRNTASSGDATAESAPDGTAGKPQQGATRSASATAAANLRPLASSSHLPPPDSQVKPDGNSDRRFEYPLPVIPRPTPSPQGTMGGVMPPPALEPPQRDGDPRSMTSAVTMAPSQWGKTVALGLVLLLIAAHLGAWTWRTRPGPHRVGPSKNRSPDSTVSAGTTACDRPAAEGAAPAGGVGEGSGSYRGRRRRA